MKPTFQLSPTDRRQASVRVEYRLREVESGQLLRVDGCFRYGAIYDIQLRCEYDLEPVVVDDHLGPECRYFELMTEMRNAAIPPRLAGELRKSRGAHPKVLKVAVEHCNRQLIVWLRWAPGVLSGALREKATQSAVTAGVAASTVFRRASRCGQADTMRCPTACFRLVAR